MHRISAVSRTATALAVVALGLSAAATPAAHAGTVTSDGGGGIVVTAGPERNSLGLQQPGDQDGRLVVYEGAVGATLTSATSACEQRDEHTAVCTWSPSAGVHVDLGDGDDSGYVSSGLAVDARFSFAGGPGDDWLTASLDGQATTLDGGPGDDRLAGGPGTDTLLGGEGADTLDGKAGGDRLHGDGGDDLLSGDGNTGTFADVVDGGAGTDTIESDWSDGLARTAPVTVTLAGGADDGRPGEGDDVHAVESITTHQATTLVGTDAAEHLEAFQTLSPTTLTGNGGDDMLKGAGGADTLSGGAGADTLDAGFGDDTIVGGPGRDTISGDLRGGDCGPLWCTLPYGNDTIDARDGEVDSISCGVGTDRVTADASDVVAPDCETVDRATPGASPDPQPQPQPAPSPRRAAANHGARACVVPSLRGARVKAAKARLKRARCTPAVRYVRGGGKRRGTVLRVSAKRGARLPSGARVTLTVARGR